MDPTTDEKLIRRKVTRCRKKIMQNAPFEELLSILNVIDQRYEDRILNAEIKRLRLAIRHLIGLEQEKGRRQYLDQLAEFTYRLTGAMRAAQMRMERVNAARARASEAS